MRIRKIGAVFLSVLFIVSNLTVQTSAKVAVKDTTQAEIKFSMMLLDNLPKPGEKDFEPFLELPSVNSLKKSRTVTLKDMNGKAKTVKINEAKVYNQIKNQVKKLITKAKNNKELNLPENMRIAREIYEFINRNVKYNEYGDNPQDAIAVYSQKMGICRGFAALTTLMMRLAEIPSADVGSVYKPGTATHAFNIIYLSGKQAKQSGWTIIDTTNANLSGISNTSNFIINELTEKKIFCYTGCLEEYFFGDDYFNRYFSISNKYIKELDGLISDFKNRIYSGENIEKINTELQSQLLKTNNRYTNKFNITSIKFIAAENSFLDILFKTNLTREYVANIVNKKEYEFYFRALNPELTFYQANKQMVEEHDKIGRVYLENLASGDNTSYSFGIVEKGVSYDITNEGDDIVIRVAGDYKYDDAKAYNVKIPKKIRDLHLPFCVWGGIDCLILQGDEELYFKGIFDSYMKIDTTNSTRYIMEDNGLFYEKKSNGQEGRLLYEFETYFWEEY